MDYMLLPKAQIIVAANRPLDWTVWLPLIWSQPLHTTIPIPEADTLGPLYNPHPIQTLGKLLQEVSTGTSPRASYPCRLPDLPQGGHNPRQCLDSNVYQPVESWHVCMAVTLPGTPLHALAISWYWTEQAAIWDGKMLNSNQCEMEMHCPNQCMGFHYTSFLGQKMTTNLQTPENGRVL